MGFQTFHKPSRRVIESHQRKVSVARGKYDETSSALTRWAIDNGHGYVRWNDLRPILEREVPAMLAANDAAKLTAELAEESAIDAMCAWRGTYNLLFWN